MSDADHEGSVHGVVRLGTRRSELALWQANHVRARLQETWGPGLHVELVEIVTDGDRILDRPLNLVGGKGLFVKGLEDQLIDGRIDLAVHSMKDLPGQLPEGLTIVCTPPREDPRDVLIGPPGARLRDLPSGTRLGTSSLRRAALARRLAPTIEIVALRGNVPTRVAKARSGACDVTLLAAAGLARLGLAHEVSEYLDEDDFCPAACQGILAIEIRGDDQRLRRLLAPLDDPNTAAVAAAERAFLARLEGGCQVPMACHARFFGDELVVKGLVIDPSGRPYFEASERGPANDAGAVGLALAESLLRAGAGRVLARFTA